MHSICPHHPGFGWGQTDVVAGGYGNVDKETGEMQYYDSPCPLCEVDRLKSEIAILKSKDKKD